MALVHIIYGRDNDGDSTGVPTGQVQDMHTGEYRAARPDDKTIWSDSEETSGSLANALDVINGVPLMRDVYSGEFIRKGPPAPVSGAAGMPIDFFRQMYSRSEVPQHGISFEQFLDGSGITEFAPGWWGQTREGRDWGFGDRAGLGQALTAAGLAFGGMAGLSGLGLLGGGEALAGAGGMPGSGYFLDAAGNVASGGFNPASLLTDFSQPASWMTGGAGNAGILSGAGAAADAAGSVAGASGDFGGGWTLDASGNPVQMAAGEANPFLQNNSGYYIDNAGKVASGEAAASDYGLGLGPVANGGSGIANIMDKVKNIPGGQSALSKIWNGTASADDWLKVGGNLAGMLTGVLASNKQSDMLKDLAEQNNAMRKPYLDASLGYLNNPQSYFGGPVAQEAMRGMGAALSKNFGNVGESPTAQTMMLQGMAPSYWNTVSQLGNIGTGGQAAATQIGLEGVKSQGNVYNVIGAGLNDLTQPKPDYAKGVLDLFKNSLV